MKKPFEMTFAEFAAAVQLSGAVNRLPEMNRGLPVYSYSVFMNGKVAEALQPGYRKYDFKDVMVTALARQLGLNPKSHQDNLKVSELVAARSAWLECVSAEHHRNQAWGLEVLSSEVLADYEKLSKGMVHPYIQGELDKQRALVERLQPVLDAASKATGKEVENLAPDEVSVGKVVSQNNDFTVQETLEGEIVTHENRRLGAIPKIGGKVAITYYRGSGQVVESLENMRVSDPFIDDESGDLAILLLDGKGKGQMILFHSLTGFNRFAMAHRLDIGLVEQASIALSEKPKAEPVRPVRVLASDVYLDKESGCLAVDYKENGVPFSVMFRGAKDLESMAGEFGLGQVEIGRARALETQARIITDKEVDESFQDLDVTIRRKLGLKDYEAPDEGKSYVGKVVGKSDLHIAQDVGRGVIVVHDLRELDKIPPGDVSVAIKYKNGRGQVDIAREQGTEKGR